MSEGKRIIAEQVIDPADIPRVIKMIRDLGFEFVVEEERINYDDYTHAAVRPSVAGATRFVVRVYASGNDKSG